MAETLEFAPDWFSPPGDTIADLLEEKGWQCADVATRAGFTPEFVEALIQGRAPLTAETAQRLSAILGGTVEFWLAREGKYREARRVSEARRS